MVRFESFCSEENARRGGPGGVNPFHLTASRARGYAGRYSADYGDGVVVVGVVVVGAGVVVVGVVVVVVGVGVVVVGVVVVGVVCVVVTGRVGRGRLG
jgi:hypothetical protein